MLPRAFYKRGCADLRGILHQSGAIRLQREIPSILRTKCGLDFLELNLATLEKNRVLVSGLSDLGIDLVEEISA